MTTITPFTQRLREKITPLWEAYLKHPFVVGIGKGTLDKEKFSHYLKQDYIYLIEYSRLFALGSAKADSLETMTIFADLLHGTLNFEMDLHRAYAEKFGISKKELEATKPSATMTAYTSYMLSQAQLGGVENTIAAVLACAWSYNFIGKTLATWPGALDHKFYGDWVKTYSSPEFSQITENCITLIDKITQGLPEKKLQELETIFIKTSYFEYMFWEMAEQKSFWPVPTDISL